MRGHNRSLWSRLLLISGLWILIALCFGGYILSLTFKESVEAQFDARLNDMMVNLIAVTTDRENEEGMVKVYRALSDPRFEQPYSGWYWQISATGFTPIRSRSLWDEALETDFSKPAAQARFMDIIGPDNQSLRVLEQDIRIDDNPMSYRYVIAMDKQAIEEQIDYFDRILIYSLGGLGVGLFLSSVLLIVFGLKPLKKVKNALSQIRSGEKSRLPNDFPKEIQPLADEMNALIEHNNEIIDRSRTQVGNLAHALKTPLTILMNEAILQRGSLADLITKQAKVMRQHVDHYLRRARAAANVNVIGVRTEMDGVLTDICRAMSLLHKDKSVMLMSLDAHKHYFRGEKQDFEQIVGNLIENAAKWASSKVKITLIERENGHEVVIDDDGPGISQDLRAAVFNRGKRLDETVSGSGLGLSIVADLIELYGGGVDLRDNEYGGLRAVVHLPKPHKK